ncbi:metal ABC transporter permease [Sporichthya brevicatena]|uniref:Metal ABC transporter permease n=1 Tax=Sporichthya brevicatena TaxID=171442 RepID=A0ABN1HBM2_9ACTN
MVSAGADFSRVINFDDYGALLELARNSLLAGIAVALVAGLMSPFVMNRELPFAVHGISELSFAGAAGALLLGTSVVMGSVLGSLLAALLIGVLGTRARDRNSLVGVLMPFGLGLGVLFLALYEGRAANKFGLLTGQIIAVDDAKLGALLTICVIVAAVMAVIWRPLTFASVDPDVAVARGINVRLLSIVFMLLLGLTIAAAIQIIGALLVLALLCTPAAAAMQVSASARTITLLSVTFATVSMAGGILLALGSEVPISPYVTTLSFAIWAVCRVLGVRRTRRGWAPRPAAPVAPAAVGT